MHDKILMLSLMIFLLFHNQVDSVANDQKPILYFFYGQDCPHCKKIKPEIDQLANQYKGLTVEKHEVWYNLTSRNKFISMAAEIGKKAEGVPAVIIGNDMYMGADIKRVRALILKYYPRK